MRIRCLSDDRKVNPVLTNKINRMNLSKHEKKEGKWKPQRTIEKHMNLGIKRKGGKCSGLFDFSNFSSFGTLHIIQRYLVTDFWIVVHLGR